VSATLDRSKVPAEYRGMARVFRDEVRAADGRINRVIAVIMPPLHARLRRHPRLREEQIAVAAKLYTRDVPAAFRIGAIEICPDRARFSIGETRLTSTWMNSITWDAREPGVAVARCSLALVSGRLAAHWTPYALVSLHALARRIERGADRSHAALVRDLAVLADAGDDGDRVPTPGGGWWRGSVVTVGSGNGVVVRPRGVRTWVDG
jgi:hypothetical protein